MSERQTETFIVNAKNKGDAIKQAIAHYPADVVVHRAAAERFKGGRDYHVNWRVEITWSLR